MSNKCKLISLGKTNKKIFLIISAVIFKIFVWQFEQLSYFDEGDTILRFNNILKSFFYSLGLLLSFSLYLIYIKCNKSTKEKLYIEKNNYTLVSISKSIKTVSKLEKFLWILIISVIDFISNLIGSIIGFGLLYTPSSWTINIIVMSLYSYCILKIKLYKHHYLSIILFSFLLIIYNLIQHIIILQYNDSFLETSFYYYIFDFIAITLNCLVYVLYKKFMQKTYLKPFEILFFQGLIELILLSILIVILVKCEVIYILEYFYEWIKEIGVIYYILLIFFNFGYYSHIYIIIDIFSPFHVFLIVFSFYALFYVYESASFLSKKFDYINVVYLIIMGLILFFTLVFIEIIELNCFGLSNMTKKNIELRAIIDSEINNDNNRRKSEKDIVCEDYIIQLDDKKSEIELGHLDTISSNGE